MKPKLLLVLVLIVSAIVPSLSQTRQTIRSTGTIRFWEYLPPSYSATGQKIPVVFFLHGLEQQGDTEEAMNEIITEVFSPPKIVEQGTDFEFVLISPQLKTNYTAWPSTYIDQVIEYVKANYNIDTDQIYLTGLSLGGGGVWGYAQDPIFGQKLRGIAPVCGHQNNLTKACNLVTNDIRVWAFHGDADPIVSVNKTINMVNAINACTPPPSPLAIKSIYAGVGHNAWDKAYRTDHSIHNPNLYEWIMQTFNALPVANAGADKNLVIPQDSVDLIGSGTTPSGTVTGYTWTQVSGASCTLNGLNSSTLNVSGLSAGTYVFSLTVTDSNSKTSAPDQVTVTVSAAANIPPVANAGNDVTITLPQSGTTLNGSGTDSDGTIITYAWTKQSGGAYTINGANTDSVSVSGLTAGTYVFRLTVTDDDGATGFDDVNVVVNAQPSGTATIWNSYDIVMQSTQAQQGLLNSSDSSIPATVAFFQSTNDGGVNKGVLLSTYNSGTHPNAAGFVATYWANATGNVYPYAGKSTVGRGSESGEGNVQAPPGVFDLQMHPPNSNKLIVSAFVVPASGDYSITNVAVRRVSSAAGTTRLKVFNNLKSQLANIQALNHQDWVLYSSPLSLGSLNAGDSIYFAVDRDGTSYASDFTELSWTINRIPPNVAPVASAGSNVKITLPQDSTQLSGTGTDSDGTIATYAWTQQSGATATITGANTQTPTISNLSEGVYVFRLTVTDDDGATAFDDVSVTVLAPTEIIWNSYDIVMQSTQAHQGLVNSSDNSTQATVSFFQSTNDGGVNKTTLLTTYNSGTHPNVNSFVATYWANATGNVYPYAGKSTVGRGSEAGEDNVPAPTGVFDLQMHPPNSNKLIVSAFVIPAAGDYTISNVAARRVSSAVGTTRLKVFNNLKSVLLNLQVTNNQDWVQSAATFTLSGLNIGDSIYFAVDRDGTSYASDFTELTWRIRQTSSSGGRLRTFAETNSGSSDEETSIKLYPNPVKNTIYFDGLADEADVKIFNSVGTLLQHSKVDKNIRSIDLNPGTFQYGFYIMILETKGVVKGYKFLKE